MWCDVLLSVFMMQVYWTDVSGSVVIGDVYVMEEAVFFFKQKTAYEV